MIRWKPSLASVAIAALVLALTPLPAAAAGGDDSAAEGDSVQSEDTELERANRAIREKHWNRAIEHLELAEKRDPDDADVQNLLGYSHRKLGDYDAAFRYYQRALDLDPSHRGALEYMGEAYLETGQTAKAEELRDHLRSLCPLGCRELTLLDDAFERHGGSDERERPPRGY